MARKVAVRAIIIQNDALFCVKLKQYGNNISGGHWCLPGGGVEDSEGLIPALERELIEELGPRPIVGNLLYVQQFIHNQKDYLEFFFHVKNADDYVNIDLGETTHGAIEIAEAQFINPINSGILPAFLETENISRHIATALPSKIFNLN